MDFTLECAAPALPLSRPVKPDWPIAVGDGIPFKAGLFEGIASLDP